MILAKISADLLAVESLAGPYGVGSHAQKNLFPRRLHYHEEAPRTRALRPYSHMPLAEQHGLDTPVLCLTTNNYVTEWVCWSVPRDLDLRIIDTPVPIGLPAFPRPIPAGPPPGD